MEVWRWNPELPDQSSIAGSALAFRPDLTARVLRGLAKLMEVIAAGNRLAGVPARPAALDMDEQQGNGGGGEAWLALRLEGADCGVRQDHDPHGA